MSHQENISAADLSPISGAERLVLMDVVRGLALLGVLWMNILAWAYPFGAYFSVLSTSKASMTYEYGRLSLAIGYIGLFALLMRRSREKTKT